MSIDRQKVIDSAQKYAAKGQYDKAIAEYMRLVKEDPNDVRVLLKVGDLQVRSGAKDDAIATYARVAKNYDQEGFHAKAIAVYKQILSIDPNLLELYSKLADLYVKQGLIPDALSQLEIIAARYQRANQEEKLLGVFRQMVQVDGTNVPCRIKLAELCSRLGKAEDAAVEFEAGGKLLRDAGREDDWAKVAERLLFHRPNDVTVARDLALYYLKNRDAKRALPKLQVCFKADPRDVATLDLLSRAFQELGQVPKALSVLKEIARIHQEAKRTEQRIETLKRILEMVPGDPEATEALAQATRPASEHPPVRARGGVSAAEPSGVQLPPPARPPPPPPTQPRPAVAPPPPPVPATAAKAPPPPPVPTAALRPPPPPPVPAIAKPAPPPVPATAPVAPPPVPTTGLKPIPVGRPAPPIAVPAPPPPPPPPPPPSSRPPPAAVVSEIPEDSATPTIPPAAEPDTAPPNASGTAQETPQHSQEEPQGSTDAPPTADPAEAARLVGEADIFLKYGLKPKALAQLQRAIEIDPASLDAHVRLRDLYVDDGDYESAAWHSIRLAELVAPGDPETALAELQNALQLSPENPDAIALYQYLSAQVQGGADPNAGQDALQDTAAQTPNVDVEAWLDEAEFMVSQGYLEDARDTLLQALTSYPNHPLLLDRYQDIEAQLAAQNEDRSFALAEKLAEAVDDARNTDAGQLNPGDQQIDVESVLSQFKKGVEKVVDPNDADTHYDLAIAYREMGLLDDAISEFGVAANNPAKACNAYTMMGLCMVEKGDPAHAIEYFGQALQVPTRTPEEELGLYFEIGNAYEALQQLEDALYCYQQVAERSPEFRNVSEKVQELASRLGG